MVVVARHLTDDVVEVGRARQRCEDLAAGDSPATLHLSGPSRDARRRAGRDAFGERLAVDVTLFDDATKHLALDLRVRGALAVGHRQ